jgi:ABC-type phosphate transport system substrate-binding protein
MKKLVLFALLALVASAAPAKAQAFTVVVNEANPVSSLSKDELSRIFLKKMTQWPTGGAIAAVDLGKGTSARESFSKTVHGRGVSAIESHWQQQIFAGKDVPPPEKPSDAEVLAFVRANAGAIGYIAAGTGLGAGVKAVQVRR